MTVAMRDFRVFDEVRVLKFKSFEARGYFHCGAVRVSVAPVDTTKLSIGVN
jgi:hypothetical protein